jgi:hypothetical protein
VPRGRGERDQVNVDRIPTIAGAGRRSAARCGAASRPLDGKADLVLPRVVTDLSLLSRQSIRRAERLDASRLRQTSRQISSSPSMSARPSFIIRLPSISSV